MASDTTNAGTLGEYVATLTLEDITDDEQRHLKYLVLDSLAVTLGGTQLPQGTKMIEFWKAVGGTGRATVPGTERQLPVLMAAYVNSYLANLLDYDDTYSGRAIGHPGATVIPPALAIGERENATGKAFLQAVLAGYEASVRVGDAIMPTPPRSRQVAATGTWQTFGATAATASLLELDAETTAHAFGLAGVSAPVPAVRKVGIEEDELHDLKNNYGWASMGGLKATLLADAGFEGNRTIFDGEKGFWRMAASDQFDPSIIAEGTGDESVVSAVSFKPYSSCRWSHATLDCVTALKPQVSVGRISSITAETFHEATTLDGEPETVLDAQFSLPYVVAIHFLDYPTGYEWLRKQHLTDPRVRSLADCVVLEEDNSMTTDYEQTGQMRARVTVELTDGTSITSEVDNPSGGPGNPIPYEAVEEKYETLVTPILGPETATELKQRVLNLEAENNIARIGRLLGESACRLP